jgi:hypothetical protein
MAPIIFVLTMRMICSSERPSSGPAKPYPALLKTTSTPFIATTLSAVSLIWSGAVTSSGSSFSPESWLSSVSLSGLRIVAMTFQPFEANSWAVALPSPEEAPVMKIVF